jgi:hypothetical protein
VRLYNVFLIAGVLRPVGFGIPERALREPLAWRSRSSDWAEQNLEGLAAEDATGLVYKEYVGD